MIETDKAAEMQLKSDTSLQILYTLYEKCCVAVFETAG